MAAAPQAENYVVHAAPRRGARAPANDPGTAEPRTSIALNNLRAVVIFVVLAFHAVSAYLGSLPRAPYAFDKAPYLWSAFPIVDNRRWFGFDLLCAWQDVYLMCLMFFLSALFAWPSLSRKGARIFLGDRIMRLGVPFVVGVTIMMPLALYPVYRVTATDPGILAYARHYLALPFLPNGPVWFLWQLLTLTVAAAAVYRFAPQWIEALAKRTSTAVTRPLRYFLVLACACILAYVPAAIVFTPFQWVDRGFFSVQCCRPLLYAVFYFAGLAVGAGKLETGLLAADGPVAQRFVLWSVAAVISFGLWIALMAFSMRYPQGGPLVLQIATDTTFAVAALSGCFGGLAVFLRFATFRSAALNSISENAFGMYLVHYPFVVWLQFALLGLSLAAIAKGSLVIAGTFLLSWVTVASLRSSPAGSQLIGGERRPVGVRASVAPRERSELARPHIAR